MAAVAAPALAPASLAPATARFRWRWIIGREADLGWVIGASLAGYAYLALNLLLHVPITLLWWVWSIGFDGTHIFGTASRTFFDVEERRRRRALLFASAAIFFALGPALVLAGQKPLLAMIVAVWAYYHVMRQHYGFVVLYKVKNGDMARVDNRLDRAFLAAMLLFPPFHRFFVHHPEELGMPQGWALTGAEAWCFAVIACVAGAWLFRQAARWRAGDAVNAPKLLLLAGVIPLHWLTFATMSWKAAVPTVTIVHNLQYHALIWFHNRNKYAGRDSARFGRVPQAVAASWIKYAALGLVFSAAYRIPGFQLGRMSDVAFGFFCGFGLTHYYLDSQIWRVRSDPGLRETLRLA